jgi:hypothetical protein
MQITTVVTDLIAQSAIVRDRRYGVIEVANGEFQRLTLRALPKIATFLDVLWLGPRTHKNSAGDRCWLYYNQPRRFPNFLAITYMVSTKNCSLASLQRTQFLIDEIARIKHSDAALCQAWNLRLSERALARYGWEPHVSGAWRRHFIKRYYGTYAPIKLAESAPAELAKAAPQR